MDLLIRNVIVNGMLIDKLYKVTNKNFFKLWIGGTLISINLFLVVKKIYEQEQRINELKNDIEILNEDIDFLREDKENEGDKDNNNMKGV